MSVVGLIQEVGVAPGYLSRQNAELIAAVKVNLTVTPVEFVTSFGPSGSGKTTTLMMIVGFTIPTDADIQLDRRSIVNVSVHQRNIGIVFLKYALFPHLSVARNEENVAKQTSGK